MWLNKWRKLYTKIVPNIPKSIEEIGKYGV